MRHRATLDVAGHAFHTAHQVAGEGPVPLPDFLAVALPGPALA